jgi:hypothetical protein
MEDITGIDSEALLAAFTAEIRALVDAGAALPFLLNPVDAFTLLSLLQLALRHPTIAGYPRELAVKLARDIEERLGKSPAIHEIARRGWLPSEDV